MCGFNISAVFTNDFNGEEYTERGRFNKRKATFKRSWFKCCIQIGHKQNRITSRLQCFWLV